MSLKEFNFNKFYENWKYFHSASNVGGIFLTYWSEDVMVWLFIQFISFAFLFFSLVQSLSFKPIRLGYANCITLMRLVIILILGLTFNELTNFTLFAWFLFAICLDGVDGFLARKFKHSSNQGELFDMEVDSFMVLLLCWIHYSINGVGWWILIPGSLRYSFEFLTSWMKRYEIIELHKKVRSTIAVLFFLSLLGPFVLPHSFAKYLLIFASSSVLLSFFSPILFYFFSLFRKWKS